MSLHVGIVGAGIGGLAAAIAIAKAGAKVTVLEAAAELGEIGAGIQMTPNAARLLIDWGVDKVIGENLVEFEELNMRKWDGTKVGYTKTGDEVRKNQGVPWWVVHRMHLHSGLAQVAEENGVIIHIDSRVASIDWTSSHQQNNTVKVTTSKDIDYTFDLLIGADGLNSIVRRTIFPDVKPRPPTNNAAYRAIVPYSQIAQDTIARELIEKPTMEVWMGDRSYIISYPISAGQDFNMVLSHHRDRPVTEVEDVDMDELRATYAHYDPRIKRIVDMIPTARRWPLLVTGPLESWSTKEKNIVLIGDAAHSMTNHMAQGAATSMEDGAFLGTVLSHLHLLHHPNNNNLTTLSSAISIYESTRIPFSRYKQQISFLNGAIWMIPDGAVQEARDRAMQPELEPFFPQKELFLSQIQKEEVYERSPNLYGDPDTVANVYGYDVIKDAQDAVEAFVAANGNTNATGSGSGNGSGTNKNKNKNDDNIDYATTPVSQELVDQVVGWWVPKSGSGLGIGEEIMPGVKAKA